MSTRLSKKEAAVFKERSNEPEFVDVLEDTFFQAARAVTDERLLYMANVVAYGLASEHVEYAEAKRMIWLLSQLVDQEVIMLRGNLPRSYDEREEDTAYRELHGSIWMPGIPTEGVSLQEVARQEEIRASYRQNLLRLGLLNDRNNVTPLGEMFLQYLELIPDWYVS